MSRALTAACRDAVCRRAPRAALQIGQRAAPRLDEDCTGIGQLRAREPLGRPGDDAVGRGADQHQRRAEQPGVKNRQPMAQPAETSAAWSVLDERRVRHDVQIYRMLLKRALTVLSLRSRKKRLFAMNRRLIARCESWPLSRPFRIARGVKTAAEVVVVEARDGAHLGWAKPCRMRATAKASRASLAQIAAIADAFADGMTRAELQSALPAGAARNAVDCALWDLEAKQTGRSVADLAGLAAARRNHHRGDDLARYARAHGRSGGETRAGAVAQGQGRRNRTARRR